MAAEHRKHKVNDPKCAKCAELGWQCIPLAVESYGGRGSFGLSLKGSGWSASIWPPQLSTYSLKPTHVLYWPVITSTRKKLSYIGVCMIVCGHCVCVCVVYVCNITVLVQCCIMSTKFMEMVEMWCVIEGQ